MIKRLLMTMAGMALVLAMAPAAAHAQSYPLPCCFVPSVTTTSTTTPPVTTPTTAPPATTPTTAPPATTPTSTPPTSTPSGAPSGTACASSFPEGTTGCASFFNLPGNTPFTATLNSVTINLGTFVSSPNGTLTVTFSTAGLPPGPHTLTISGGGISVSAPFTVTATGAQASGPTSGTGGLAFTGAQVAGLVVLAFALLAIGLLALGAGRRRRHTEV